MDRLPEPLRREIPGREDNTRAQDFLDRGPAEPIAEPEKHLKVALVHSALTLLSFENAGRVMEEAMFRRALQQVCSDDEITTMKGYLIGTTGADASRREINGVAEAMGGNLLQHRTRISRAVLSVPHSRRFISCLASAWKSGIKFVSSLPRSPEVLNSACSTIRAVIAESGDEARAFRPPASTDWPH